MASNKDDYDIMYEENRALLETCSPSFQTAVFSSPSSIGQLCQLNGVVDVAAEEEEEEERFIPPPPLPPSSPEHLLDEISARGRALSVLTRIARHIGRNVDDLLSDLLPHSGYWSLLNPRGEQLVHWGRLIHANCTQTGPEGFVSGIPVTSVADPTALANLHALAAWPVNKRRMQALGDSMDYLEQLLSDAVAGFPVVLGEKEMEVELATFLRLVKFILQDEASSCKNEADETMLSAHDDCVEVREADLGPVDVPFMDESRIASDAAPSATTPDGDLGAVARYEKRLRLAPTETENGEIVISPGGVESLKDDTMQDPKVKKICVDDLPSPHKVVSHSGPKSKLVVSQFHILKASDTAKAIQLALLLLPPLLRYQLQVFVEIAQDITASIQAHVRPASRHIAEPKTLARAFAPRFFGVPKNPNEPMGEALLKFILSYSTPLHLLKPPIGALDSPINTNTQEAKPLKRTCPVERKVRARQPLKALIDFDNISIATGASVDLQEGTGTRLNPHHYPVSAALLALPVCTPESYKNISKIATQQALLDTLNCLISDASMNPKQKLEYLMRYQKTHPDILQKRFTDEEELKQLMEKLEEEAAARRESSLKDRVVGILRRRRRRSHLGGKKRALTPMR